MNHFRLAAEHILASKRHGLSRVHPLVPTNAADYPHLDVKSYDEFADRMQAKGFRLVGDMAKPSLTHVPASGFHPVMIRVMASADGQMQAACWQTRTRLGRQLRTLMTGLLNLRLIAAPRAFANAMKRRRCVDIETEFDNGVYLCTTNAEGASKVCMPPCILKNYLPYGTAAETLLEDHMRRLQEYLREHPGVHPRRLHSAGEIAASAARQEEAKRAYCESNGWITKEELMRYGRPDIVDGVYAEVQKILAEERARAEAA